MACRGLAGQSAQLGQCVLASHGTLRGGTLALLNEGAPLSREAVAQQDEGAGSLAPGAASLSARQEATEVEAPVYLAPARRSKERRKTGSCLK